MKKNSEEKNQPADKTKGFFDVHPGVVGLFILLGLVVFPRLTTFFMYRGSVSPWGLLLWLLLPRFLIAIVASQRYRQTDPVLVYGAWAAAILVPIFTNRYYMHWNWDLPPFYYS